MDPLHSGFTLPQSSGDITIKPKSTSRIPESTALPEDPTITGSTAFVVHDSAANFNTDKGKVQQLFTDNSYKGSQSTPKDTPAVKYGDVIVLAGTLTAGKSSIVGALKKLDPEINEKHKFSCSVSFKCY